MRHLLGCRNPFHPLHGWSHQRHGSISLSTHTILSQLTHRFRMPFCMLERLISCVVFVCLGVVILCFYVVDIRFSVYAIRVTLSTWTLDVEIARRAINTRLHRAHAMQLQILLPAPATLVSGRELQSSNMRVFWRTRLGAHWPIAERCIWLSGRDLCVSQFRCWWCTILLCEIATRVCRRHARRRCERAIRAGMCVYVYYH